LGFYINHINYSLQQLYDLDGIVTHFTDDESEAQKEITFRFIPHCFKITFKLIIFGKYRGKNCPKSGTPGYVA